MYSVYWIPYIGKFSNGANFRMFRMHTLNAKKTKTNLNSRKFHDISKAHVILDLCTCVEAKLIDSEQMLPNRLFLPSLRTGFPTRQSSSNFVMYIAFEVIGCGHAVCVCRACASVEVCHTKFKFIL